MNGWSEKERARRASRVLGISPTLTSEISPAQEYASLADKIWWETYEEENARALIEARESLRGNYRGKPTAPHGTITKYRRGCRCKECKKANTEYMQQYRGSSPRPKPTHGTIAMYNYHKCRCAVCKTTMRAYRRANRAKKAEKDE